MLNKLIDYFAKLFHWLTKRPSLKTVYVEDIPDSCKKGFIYIVGNDNPWYAVVKCPCECGETIRLCLQEEVKPSWKLSYCYDGSVSLQPSIWRTRGCQSHFFITKGSINWCKGQAD